MPMAKRTRFFVSDKVGSWLVKIPAVAVNLPNPNRSPDVQTDFTIIFFDMSFLKETNLPSKKIIHVGDCFRCFFIPFFCASTVGAP